LTVSATNLVQPWHLTPDIYSKHAMVSSYDKINDYMQVVLTRNFPLHLPISCHHMVNN